MTGRKIIYITILAISITHISALISQVIAGETPNLIDGEAIYKHYCTPCHGIKGDGKGFNANNLDPRPANHSDAEFMSKRTDKELYEVISGGGRAVGRSSLMPPWGNTFNENEIKSLILYMRKLCKCKGT
jgi:mono/diheme cytochrome c family protein